MIIKEKPEDFVVNEEMDLEVKDKGRYIYFILKKKEWNSLDAVREIARRVGVSTGNFNIAGNKDKYAVTSQYVSVSGVSKEKLMDLKIRDISVKFVGYGSERIALGDLSGNKFKIVVRDLDSEKIRSLRYVPNYFDEQRFGGGLRGNNAKIGKLLVKKDYEEAMKVFLGKPHRREMKKERECRKWLDSHWGDWKDALEKYPKFLVNERNVLDYLSSHEKDYVGGFRRLNKKILSLFIHAYQSLLWNEVLAEYLKSKGDCFEIKYSQGRFVFLKDGDFKDLKIPIFGFLTEFSDSEIEKIYSKILKREELKSKDFVNRQIPYLSSEGLIRDGFVKIKGLKFKFSDDELFSGKKKCVLEFGLGKGSYGSIVVKGLFS